MNEALEQLQQALQTIEGDHSTKCAAEWLVLDIASLLNKPTARHQENIQQSIGNYLEAWVIWKAKQ